MVMIRLPNRTTDAARTETTANTKTNRKKNNAVVLTAIALLPELIAVIKN